MMAERCEACGAVPLVLLLVAVTLAIGKYTKTHEAWLCRPCARRWW